MIKPLKFTTDNVFFFSDFHCSHAKDFILNPRGFKTAEEGKEILIKNWNAKVTNNDICFLLGDSVVGAGPNGREVFSEILRRLNYKEIYIMPGNHFSGFSSLFEEKIKYGIDLHYRLSFNGKNIQTEEMGISGHIIHLIPNYFEIQVKNQFIVLSHYPILSFNGQNKKSICIFGHTHNNLGKSNIGKEYLKGRVLEVSPEAIGNFPLSFGEVMERIGNREAIKIDHHDLKTT